MSSLNITIIANICDILNIDIEIQWCLYTKNGFGSVKVLVILENFTIFML